MNDVVTERAVADRRWRNIFLLQAAAATALVLVVTDRDALTTSKVQFLLLNLGLVYYLLWETWRLVRRAETRPWLHPAALASYAHFILGYFIPNLRYLTDVDWVWMPGGHVRADDTLFASLNRTMLFVILAAFAMWRGYKSQFSVAVGERIASVLKTRGWVKEHLDVRFGVAGAFFVASIVAWVIQIQLGVFAYNSDQDLLAKTLAIRNWLETATDGAKLVLLVLALCAFSERYRNNVTVWWLFIALLVWQTLLGFLSGFKSQVIAPAVTAALAYYVMKGRTPLRWLVVTGVLLFFAYAVVQPFRELRYSSRDFDGRSLRSIAGTAVVAATTQDGGEEGQPFFDALLGRQDVTTPTSVAISFKDERGVPPGSPEFLEDLWMSPLNAYIPRFAWPTKRKTHLGVWFNVEVLGAPATAYTAVAMGPVGYFNFAGGIPMVIIGFLLFGFLQRVTYDALISNGAGGALMFLVLLAPLVMLPDDVASMLAGFLRMLPVVMFAQILLLRPSREGHNEFAALATSPERGRSA